MCKRISILLEQLFKVPKLLNNFFLNNYLRIIIKSVNGFTVINFTSLRISGLLRLICNKFVQMNPFFFSSTLLYYKD